MHAHLDAGEKFFIFFDINVYISNLNSFSFTDEKKIAYVKHSRRLASLSQIEIPDLSKFLYPVR